MTDSKLLRFAAVLVVLAGYAFVFRAGEARIAERLAENARIAEQLRAGERTIAARAKLERERAHLRARLHLADLGADRSALVARFLRDAATIAAMRRTAITAIAATGASATPPDEPFDLLPLEVTVEGRYADVLATIRALSNAPVLASVDVASLARKNAAAAEPTVTAALRVVLERIVPPSVLEPAGVRPRPV